MTLKEITVNGFDSICRKGNSRAAPSEMTYMSLGLVSSTFYFDNKKTK